MKLFSILIKLTIQLFELFSIDIKILEISSTIINRYPKKQLFLPKLYKKSFHYAVIISYDVKRCVERLRQKNFLRRNSPLRSSVARKINESRRHNASLS